jgi:hypothetical protein
VPSQKHSRESKEPSQNETTESAQNPTQVFKEIIENWLRPTSSEIHRKQTSTVDATFSRLNNSLKQS